ncbi:MAG TPA: outer membrane beta-barrel protein, partial [Bacteroidia bacterium]|nr:outer membrane beta-barrel protein [Bacteroidia bacterium]
SNTGNIIYSTQGINYSFSYVQLPLLFRLVTPDPGKVGLDLQGGLIFGFLLNASESGTISQQSLSLSGDHYYYVSSTNDPANAVSKVGNVNNLTSGLALSIGLYIPLSNTFCISLGFMGTYNLNYTGNGGQDMVTFGNGVKFNYNPGDYGKAYSILFNPKLIIRLGKPNCLPLLKDNN